MKIVNFISEKVTLPLSDLITGQRAHYYLNLLMKSQWWSQEEMKEYQNYKLRNLITFAVNTVPYYQSLFKKQNLSIDDIQSMKDLYKIPILKKDEIKKAGKNIFSSNRISGRKVLKASSSGSTGEPLFYFTTKDAYSLNIAANLRGWYWMGYRLGDKYVKLSQNPRKNALKQLQDKLSRNYYLTTNPLNDSNFKFILSEIEEYKPKVIRCYPDPLLFLARFKQEHPEFKYAPSSITTTGNTLHDETRHEIETAFNCKVFDSYSCEGNSIVFECPTHKCYHSTEEYGISEIIDKNGNLVKDGIGKLITTDLCNFAHPFIRYDTQDLVEVTTEACSCGRNLLRINRIIGRDSDVIDTPNGKYIVHDFTIFFALQNTPLKKSVDKFQVVKTKGKSIIFYLVINDFFNSEVKHYIKDYWEKQFKLPVKVRIIDKISLTKSGKRRFIINENL